MKMSLSFTSFFTFIFVLHLSCYLSLTILPLPSTQEEAGTEGGGSRLDACCRMPRVWTWHVFQSFSGTRLGPRRKHKNKAGGTGALQCFDILVPDAMPAYDKKASVAIFSMYRNKKGIQRVRWGMFSKTMWNTKADLLDARKSLDIAWTFVHKEDTNYSL